MKLNENTIKAMVEEKIRDTLSEALESNPNAKIAMRALQNLRATSNETPNDPGHPHNKAVAGLQAIIKGADPKDVDWYAQIEFEEAGGSLQEGDVSREKRYNDLYGGDSPHETMGDLKFSGDLDQSAMPDQGPEALVKQAKEIHTSLMQNATATVSGDKDIALNRVLVRRDLRDLGELLDQLQAQLGSGPSELEARGHDDFSSQKEKFMAP